MFAKSKLQAIVLLFRIEICIDIQIISYKYKHRKTHRKIKSNVVINLKTISVSLEYFHEVFNKYWENWTINFGSNHELDTSKTIFVTREIFVTKRKIIDIFWGLDKPSIFLCLYVQKYIMSKRMFIIYAIHIVKNGRS